MQTNWLFVYYSSGKRIKDTEFPLLSCAVLIGRIYGHERFSGGINCVSQSIVDNIFRPVYTSDVCINRLGASYRKTMHC